MDKPITKWPSDSAITLRPDGREERMSLEAMAREGLVAPSYQLPPDGEYRPEHAALAQAEGGGGKALADFYREAADVEVEVRRHERRYHETREPIARAAALALARRIMDLRLRRPVEAREDYIAVLAGQCLQLREARQAAGEVYAACARLEVKRPAVWAGRWWQVTLAVPAGIRVHGPEATFGTHTFPWLRYRCERVARTLARRGTPPASPVYRMFDGGGFALVIDSIRPGEVAEPVVLAPDEDAVAKHVERAASCPDHWDALEKAERVLRRTRQPLGEALGNWLEARPDGRKAAKWPRKAQRNAAIIEAVRALERCGIPPTRNRDKRWLARAHGWNGEVDRDYNPPSGCGIVAEVSGEVFGMSEGMSARAVEEVLKPVPE